jgi:hypothetical protein
MSSVNLLHNGISIDQALVLASILKTHDILKSLCGNNGDETELDMSEQNIGAAEATLLTSEIAGNGALTSLSLVSNNLGKMVLPKGWSYGYHDERCLGNVFYKHTDGREKKNGTPEGTTSGAIVIANAIPDMRALLSLDISSNNISAEGTKLLAKAIEGNQTMTSLNISSNDVTYDGKKYGDMSGVAALADVLPGMGAMSQFTFDGDRSLKPITMEISMTKAYFSAKGLGKSGAILVVAAFLPKCT